MARDVKSKTLVQLLDAAARDAASALATLQPLIATAPFMDRALASVELDLIQITAAVDRAQALLHHAVQVLSGLQLPDQEPEPGT
jgi:hypothetical protein